VRYIWIILVEFERLTNLCSRRVGCEAPIRGAAGEVQNIKEVTMRWVLYIVGVLLFLMGSVWILQGIGLYPVGGMAFQVKWAYIGAVVDLVGIGLIVLASRRRKNLPPSSKA
jgi:hypothetical protein